MIIKNNLIPFKGFIAMAAWPFIFVRKDWIEKDDWMEVSVRYDTMLNHEKIHLEQQVEVSVFGLVIAISFSLIFGFNWWFILFPILLYYLMYGIDYLLGVVSGEKEPYRNICFEREAYSNESNLNYLHNRKYFSWIKYNSVNRHP